MVWWGTVSYSIYLFHPVVFYSLFYFLQAGAVRSGISLGLWVLLCAVATIALASLVYVLVEAPANRYASRLARRTRSAEARNAPEPEG
jgi:peptidoglycan/LPS O-acetylase OafA/YrhL